MTLNLHAPETEEQLKPRITVMGVGGAGGNAVNNMITENLEGVDFIVTNTDAQALTQSECGNRLQLGRNLTRGLGGGSRPDVGRAAAEEAIDEIADATADCDMLFIAAGMGGATGTGAAPVIARTAREKGILTVAVVTKPFQFEGVHRARIAEQGLTELEKEVDTLIIIPNQNLFRLANEKTTFADAFKMADEVLYSGVRGVTDLVVKPGLINLDFADIRSVMTEMGKAMMGTGEAGGENRAISAAEAAISNPLLDDVSMRGARGVLINITGGDDLTLFEVDEAANRIRDEVDPDANIIFGSTFDPSVEGTMRISVVATGINQDEDEQGNEVTVDVASGQRRGGGQPAGGGEPRERAQAQPQPRTEPRTEPRREAVQPEPAQREPEPEPVQAREPRTPVEAEDREEAFIAPAPQEPRAGTRDEGPGVAGGRRRDPFQAAAPAGETPAPESGEREHERVGRGRAGNLFDRLTGAARMFGDRDKNRDPRPEQPTRARVAEPTLGGARQGGEADAADARAPRRSEAATDQRSSEEDQLDIPAFLRRQAN
ncbi:cell division protein FtsZ [Limimonas halophila]|uniref:Cell division protein FtsZ n=1 Tax=Limimonas halophila TaxID=1082479 RepID=A0A1G7U572_9PROT|nr:cell division protein FtsZ [Limimonas halophila]SDG42564.1 cell division protein FtsZ [Limimonas halophila]